jgi:syntaxin 6
MFGLDDAEVIERRRYVGRVRREIQDMRAEVEGALAHSRVHTPQPATPNSNVRRSGPTSSSSPPDVDDREDAEDHQRQWAREEQMMMMQEQDRTMDSISGTLNTLAQQAGLRGREILEHNEMLDDLEVGVDRTDNKLSGAMRRMRKFIRQTEETKSGWCIMILVVILMILLLAVILV